MKYTEIQQMDLDEIERLIEEKRDELRSVRFEISAKRLGNHRQHRQGSVDLARLLTALQDKKKQLK